MGIVPAKLRVLVTIRPKYICRACKGALAPAPSTPLHSPLHGEWRGVSSPTVEKLKGFVMTEEVSQ